MQEGQLTLKLCMLFLEALKKFPQPLEQVLVPLFPKLINTLVQQATEAEVATTYHPVSQMQSSSLYSAFYLPNTS